MTDAHDHERLAAYAVGLLPDHDRSALTAHVEECSGCQAELSELRTLDTALQATPAELFVEGPPPGADWVLRRAARQLRREFDQHHDKAHRRRRSAIAAAALIAITITGGAAGGYALHHQPAAATSVVAAPPPIAIAGTRTVTGLNPSSGARIDVTLTPNAGWVGVKASIAGLPIHQRCMLVVIDNTGDRFVVGSWAVPDPSEGSNSYEVDAGAAVPLTKVSAVTVESFDNQMLVKAPV